MWIYIDTRSTEKRSLKWNTSRIIEISVSGHVIMGVVGWRHYSIFDIDNKSCVINELCAAKNFQVIPQTFSLATAPKNGSEGP